MNKPSAFKKLKRELWGDLPWWRNIYLDIWLFSDTIYYKCKALLGLCEHEASFGGPLGQKKSKYMCLYCHHTWIEDTSPAKTKKKRRPYAKKK